MEWINLWWQGEDHALWLLFAVALLAATFIPLGSEPLFLLTLATTSHPPYEVLFIATLGNTLGGMINYGLGRWGYRVWTYWRHRYKLKHPSTLISEDFLMAKHPRLAKYLRRFGVVACVFSWLPVVGDVIPLLAGAMRLNVAICGGLIALGKGLRYFVLMQAINLH